MYVLVWVYACMYPKVKTTDFNDIPAKIFHGHTLTAYMLIICYITYNNRQKIQEMKMHSG